MTKKKTNTTDIPQHEVDSLARIFLPAILNFYRSEEGQCEFEKWKAMREREKLNILFKNKNKSESSNINKD